MYFSNDWGLDVLLIVTDGFSVSFFVYSSAYCVSSPNVVDTSDYPEVCCFPPCSVVNGGLRYVVLRISGRWKCPEERFLDFYTSLESKSNGQVSFMSPVFLLNFMYPYINQF